MQFSGKHAARQRWVESPSEHHAREVSYDLSVGRVIINGHEVEPQSSVNAIEIHPQQVFVIVSKEKVSVPRSGVSCFAFPKTGLCRQGLLALNTGIVDPGYQGLISTTAINFHSKPIKLLVGDAFLRLAFFRLDCDQPAHVEVADEREYVKGLLTQSLELPASFLDVPATVDRLQENLSEKLRSDNLQFSIWKIGAVLTGAALLLTVALSLLPAITPRLAGSLYVKTIDIEHQQEFRALQDKVQVLTEELKELQQPSQGGNDA